MSESNHQTTAKEQKNELTVARRSGVSRWVLIRFLLIVLLSPVFIGCDSAPDRFGKLNLMKWRSDRGGCQGVRAGLVPDFKAEVQHLKGKTTNTIGELLGRPDINQIADRNQKFYIYFLDKGPQCDQPGAKSQSRSVAIRMSAMGVATEITFQDGLP